MASHSLIRVKGSLVNTPHLIDSSSFNSIMEYVNKRIDGSAEIIPKSMGDDEEYSSLKKEDFYLYNEDTKTGILQVDGPISYKTSGWEALCGGTSCQMLKEQMEYFVERGAKTVGMFVDSGGGEARGLFDTATYLRQLADDNGIKIVAFSEGMAASAAYALPAIADEFVATWDARIGSIGVLISLMSDQKALEKEGYERVFVVSNEGKIPYAKDGSFRKEWLDDLQRDVNALYDTFTTHVSNYRPMNKQQVIETDARVFMAEEALSLGLIDKVMKVEEFYDYLALVAQSNLEESDMSNPLKDMFKLKTKEDKAEMSQLKELQALAETQEALLQDKEAALVASLEQITTLEASVGELTSKLEALQAFAEEHEAAAKAAQAEAQRVAEEAAQAKIDQRKASLKEVLAEDQLEATYAALSSLDDASFSVIVSQYAATKEARAEAFKAVGGEGVEQESLVAEHDSVDAIRQAGVAKARERYAK